MQAGSLGNRSCKKVSQRSRSVICCKEQTPRPNVGGDVEKNGLGTERYKVSITQKLTEPCWIATWNCPKNKSKTNTPQKHPLQTLPG